MGVRGVDKTRRFFSPLRVSHVYDAATFATIETSWASRPLLGALVKTYFTSIAHNLASLWRFSGNDGRGLFWPYTITVAILIYAAMMSAMVPEMERTVSGMTRPEDVFSIDMSGMMRWTLLFSAVAMVLLSASVVRRLRDRAKSPLWALLPVVLTMIGYATYPTNVEGILSMPRWATFAMFLVSLTTQISLIYLIVLLAGRSRPGKAGASA
ncbi:Protein of unknown function [Mesorhizobium australicum]|uniref:Uncharacterized protein n=1 Tax=Mesorhizobium australicum TaxID=536018 RepID=A0A1X7P4U7_9HYPH|nr:Protein of unknown function [Mesorhizobium australicum]